MAMQEPTWQAAENEIYRVQRFTFHHWIAAAAAILSELPNYSWVGFYWLVGDRLLLGSWHGPAATEHTSIPLGQGVCGRAARVRQTIIVDDVSKDPRYLSCFPSTKSEIVVPIFRNGDNTQDVVGEIDIDSDKIAAFTRTDVERLEALAANIGRRYPPAFDPRECSAG